MAHSANNPLQLLLDNGSEAFAASWRRWVKQWTQPQLLRLSQTYLGGRMFHSSQMAGFASRQLQNPAPKVFLAVGALNLAHARSLGFTTAQMEAAPDLGLDTFLPGALRNLWEGREPIRDAEGVCLGPVGLFEAFCGLRALPSAPEREIAPEALRSVCERLGARLRVSLISRGIDFVLRRTELSAVAPSVGPLLNGETVPAAQLLNDLQPIAALLQTTADQVWHDLTTQVDSETPRPESCEPPIPTPPALTGAAPSAAEASP